MESTLYLERRTESNIFVACSIFCMAILLHQSIEIFGINLSFSDFFCILLMLYFAYSNKLMIPQISIVFFLLVSSLVLLTATIYVPYKFKIYPEAISVVSNYLKLVAIFGYYIVGYTLAKFNHLEATLKWYSVAGIIIGAMGMIVTFLNIQIFSAFLFYGDIRFRGLMIDPNYFAVLQITAFVFISRSKNIKGKYKWLAALITLASVLVSGSKTGMITMFSYLIFRLVEFVFIYKKKTSALIAQLITIGLLIGCAPFGYYLLQLFMNEMATYIPAFARVSTLFTDFNSAVSANGSGRGDTWNIALHIILSSPLIGIGIGTYSTLAYELYYSESIAHNTFLQLAAEWGFPIAFIFFTYIFSILVKITIDRKRYTETNLVLRDIIIIFLIGSLAITLSNARGLWLFLGALTYSLKQGGKNGSDT